MGSDIIFNLNFANEQLRFSDVTFLNPQLARVIESEVVETCVADFLRLVRDVIFLNPQLARVIESEVVETYVAGFFAWCVLYFHCNE